MLLTLPLLAFVLVWVGLASRAVGSHGIEVGSLRPSLLAAASLCGGYLALGTEALSLVHGITPFGVALLWSLAIAGAAFFGWRSHAQPWLAAWWKNRPWSKFDAVDAIGLGIAAILIGALLLLALLSPPNNTDSLLYHMSRVVHWQQNASLAHYPTAYNNQLWTQIWAEIAILHTTLLVGSDWAANLIQWAAMVGSIVAASMIAGLLGAGRMGRWLAAAFTLSLPIGILESTSTQNDYVAGFWLIAFTYFVVLATRRSLSRLEWLSMCTALGLGVLTKATIYLFAFPVAIWFLFIHLRRQGLRKATLSALGMASIIGVLNLGYWIRDIVTFGGPFGSAEWAGSKVPLNGLASYAVGPIRQILLNFATPSERATALIVSGQKTLEAWLGIADSTFRLTWAWNNEDFAGNPLHVFLVAASLIGILWLWRKYPNPGSDKLAETYALLSFLSFLTFSTLAKFSEHGIRYQIPIFIMFAPVVGFVAERFLPRRSLPVGALGLAVISLPWIFFNQSRPLITWRPRTRVNSVLIESRQQLLFANWPEFREPYSQAASLVGEASCQRVGLVIDSHDKEYLLWSVLGAPENGMRLEVLDPLSASARYLDPAFHPCAVVCTICGADRTEWGGLPLAGEFGSVKVYLRPGQATK